MKLQLQDKEADLSSRTMPLVSLPISHEDFLQQNDYLFEQKETTTTVRNHTSAKEQRRSIFTGASLIVGMIALYTASQYCGEVMIHMLLPEGASMRSDELAIANMRLDGLLAAKSALFFLLTTLLAIFVKPRVNQWAIPIANILYYLAVTTEYSLTAMPVWVLSQSQIAGWSRALVGAAILSLLQIVVAQQIAQWRKRRSEQSSQITKQIPGYAK